MFYFWLTTISSHDARWRKTKIFNILTRHNQLTNNWTKTLNLVSKIIVSEKFRFVELSLELEWERSQTLVKHNTNTQWKWRKTKSLQNTHAEVNIFAREKSKARSKVWIVQNNLHIAET